MNLTRDLAGVVERGSAGRSSDLTSRIVVRSILDWLGCAISGSSTEAARIAGGYARDTARAGQCQVVASPLRLDAAAAAWLNGIQGHIDDFDDSGSHPASYLTPTVLALGEETSASGARVIEAWTIGYEVASRLGEGIRPDRGWHTTPLYGTLGAAAAASILLDLSQDQIEHALGIAASSTAGLMRNFGSMTKAAHPGNAARAGVEAARLAQRSFEARPGIIEGQYGLVDCFGGEKAHLPSIGSGLSDALCVERRPPVIKAWPCCTGIHRSLTAVLAFMEEIALPAEEIVRIEHYGPLVPGEGPLQFSAVSTPLEGKFSLEYTVAAAIIDKRVDHDTYSDARFSRGDIQALMTRIHRHQSPQARLHSARTVEGMDVDMLRIELRGGHVHELKLGPRRVLDGSEVEEKFAANAARGPTSARPEAIIDVVRELERASSISALMSMLATADSNGTGRDER